MTDKADLRTTLPEELRQKAHIKSAKENVSISEKVRETLREWTQDVELEE